MMQRDIIRVVEAVAPDDGSGAANVKVVRKVCREFLVSRGVRINPLSRFCTGSRPNHSSRLRLSHRSRKFSRNGRRRHRTSDCRLRSTGMTSAICHRRRHWHRGVASFPNWIESKSSSVSRKIVSGISGFARTSGLCRQRPTTPRQTSSGTRRARLVMMTIFLEKRSGKSGRKPCETPVPIGGGDFAEAGGRQANGTAALSH